MEGKDTNCSSCDDLKSRLDRLERRLDRSEKESVIWNKRYHRSQDELKKANGKISILEHKIETLNGVIEKKDAQIQHLLKDKFGRKSESETASEATLEEQPAKRPRGKQPGAKGFGRKIRSNLPVEMRSHDVRPSDRHCSACGKERQLLPFTEDSEEIEYTYKLVRVKHQRLKYRKTCSCTHSKSIVTAPPPPKLIPKGMLSIQTWTHVLLEKYWLQRPLSRICMSLKLQGLDVAESTFASGLKTLTKLFAPLYNALRSHSRTADHWHMDETHWRVFTDLMGKANHNWWLWVVETKDTTVFLLDPTRSSSVPKRHLKGIPAGIVTCDRYSAYQPLLEQGLELSYCWAHVRRDFIRLRDGFPSLQEFGKEWVERISALFHAHSSNNRKSVRTICSAMQRDTKRLLKLQTLHTEARAALASLQKHWHGLTLFLEFSDLPLDNNSAERALRNVVVGRKCYYGSRSIWSGSLAAMLFSIFSTLAKNRIEPRQFMLEYLTACAENNGKAPPNISDFLPWNFSLEPQATMVH